MIRDYIKDLSAVNSTELLNYFLGEFEKFKEEEFVSRFGNKIGDITETSEVKEIERAAYTLQMLHGSPQNRGVEGAISGIVNARRYYSFKESNEVYGTIQLDFSRPPKNDNALEKLGWKRALDLIQHIGMSVPDNFEQRGGLLNIRFQVLYEGVLSKFKRALKYNRFINLINANKDFKSVGFVMLTTGEIKTGILGVGNLILKMQGASPAWAGKNGKMCVYVRKVKEGNIPSISFSASYGSRVPFPQQ